MLAPSTTPITQRKPPIRSANTMLLDTWVITSIITTAFFLYNVFTSIEIVGQGIRLFNHTLADASMVLIGLSLALSGICHFWNFADTYISYRKYIGLAGFYLAAAHTVIAITQRPIAAFLTEQRIVPFLAAVVSIMLLAIMATISNTSAIKRLGYARWKKILALGYVAYLAGIVHFGILNQQRWLGWLSSSTVGEIIMPPLSLIIFVFGCFVLGLRIALWIDTRKR